MGVEGLAALHLRKFTVLALDGIAADQAVLPDLHRCLAEAEAHALQLCIAHLVLGGADAALVTAGIAGDVAGTVADGGAGAVHGRVAHADHSNIITQTERLGVCQIVDAKGYIAQRLALDMHGVCLPQTGTDEHALVAVAEQIIDGDGLADGGVGPHLDALQLQMAVLEIVQHAVRQAVVGDAVAHDAADLIAGIKDGHIVAPACQQHRNGQARRARANDCRLHAVFGGRAGGHFVGVGRGNVVFNNGEVDRVVAGHPVAHTVAFALVLVVAHQRTDGGQRVIFKQHPAGLVHLVCLEQTDDLRDIGVDGAALLAQRLFAAQAAVGFVQNVKCHEVSSLLRAVF